MHILGLLKHSPNDPLCKTWSGVSNIIDSGSKLEIGEQSSNFYRGHYIHFCENTPGKVLSTPRYGLNSRFNIEKSLSQKNVNSLSKKKS